MFVELIFEEWIKGSLEYDESNIKKRVKMAKEK